MTIDKKREESVGATQYIMRSISHSSFDNRHSSLARAFTLFELLIALAIIGLILASVVPYIMHQREVKNRTQCAYNLYVIRSAMQTYAFTFEGFPRVRYDAQNKPSGWTAYTGADDANPFAADSRVQPNDVTASLYLLVREGYVTDAKYFLCPSAGGTADEIGDPKKRSNFRSGESLGYSMFNPFSSAPEFAWTYTLKPECVLLADKNPGVLDANVAGPNAHAMPEAFAQANSLNHDRAGQNVLKADGSVEFVTTPYVGVGYTRAEKDTTGKWTSAHVGDNIYTALQATPVPEGHKPPAEANGVYGKEVGAAWLYDSFLVPSDDE